MFSFDLRIDDDYHDCSLLFKNDIIELHFSPESPHLLIEGEKGDFIQDTSNGNCEFSWDRTSVSFSTAKFGCGNGGSQNVTLHLTPEQMASFHAAIRKWNAFQTHLAQGKSASSF